jgi:hypothetical protein
MNRFEKKLDGYSRSQYTWGRIYFNSIQAGVRHCLQLVSEIRSFFRSLPFARPARQLGGDIKLIFR